MSEIYIDELHTITEDILPDLQRQLSELTSPDYKPEDNPDDELRDQDIEFLQSEIRREERRAAYLNKQALLDLAAEYALINCPSIASMVAWEAMNL